MPELQTERHHLLIGGTGRAGTSFLVRFLTALGLDTTLSRRGDDAIWDEHANAGLEERLGAAPSSWPYVVKTPWLYQIIDQLLSDGSIKLDTVIIPVRSLQEAAASRVILELRAIYAAHPQITDQHLPRGEWGSTPGGCFLPLEPLDQKRLLAVGFHNVIERLISADVPIVFIAFPRLVKDPDYLFTKLTPFLPGVTVAEARQVHARLAEPAMVRVDIELQSVAANLGAQATEAWPSFNALSEVAIRRELGSVRAELAAAAAKASNARAEADQAREQVVGLKWQNEALAAAKQELAHLMTTRLFAAEVRAANAESEVAQARIEVQDLKQQNEALAVAGRELARGRAQLVAADETAAEADQLHSDLRQVSAEYEAVLASTSCRITAPLRAISARIRRRL